MVYDENENYNQGRRPEQYNFSFFLVQIALTAIMLGIAIYLILNPQTF